MKLRVFPYLLFPFSCIQRALKFSTVFDVLSPNEPRKILAAGVPSISMFKVTFYIAVSFVANAPVAASVKFIFINNYYIIQR